MDTTVLIKKLESIGTLSDHEKEALTSIPATVRDFDADQDIVRERDHPSMTCLLLEGLACRYKIAEGGRRQIMAFHIPGDIPDLQSLFLKTLDHSISALEPTRVAAIPHSTMLGIIEKHPRIGYLLWRDTLIDAAVFREWMVGIGRRSAYARIAHLFCEMIVRMEVVGLGSKESCKLPITQAEIGDALGLSTVHVNRTLQELRANDLITLQGTHLVALDWEGLKEAGDFDPTYLHLEGAHKHAA